jgi:Tfp pilus assembly protein PilE
MEHVPAGWYADPLDVAQQRWWDGSGWSGSTRVAQASQPVATATVPPPGVADGDGGTPPPPGMESAALQHPVPGAMKPPTTTIARPGKQMSPPSGGAAWGAAPPARPTTDPLAIVALVAGLLWALGLGSIVAIVCAIVVLRRGAEGTSRTLAFVGLGLGVLGILPALLVLAVLGAISMPVFLQQQDAALEAVLHSDLRNAAITQESVFTASGSYTADVRELEAGSLSSFASELTVVRASATGYCIEASNEGGTAHISNPGLTPSEGPC